VSDKKHTHIALICKMRKSGRNILITNPITNKPNSPQYPKPTNNFFNKTYTYVHIKYAIRLKNVKKKCDEYKDFFVSVADDLFSYFHISCTEGEVGLILVYLDLIVYKQNVSHRKP